MLELVADNKPSGVPVGTWKHTGGPGRGGLEFKVPYVAAVAPLEFFTQNFGSRGRFKAKMRR